MNKTIERRIDIIKNIDKFDKNYVYLNYYIHNITRVYYFNILNISNNKEYKCYMSEESDKSEIFNLTTETKTYNNLTNIDFVLFSFNNGYLQNIKIEYLNEYLKENKHEVISGANKTKYIKINFHKLRKFIENKETKQSISKQLF